MAATTVREHRLAAGYAIFIPSSLAFGLLLAGHHPAFLAAGLRSRPGLCRPGSTPCAALARRGRSQHPRLGPRVRLPPASVLGVPRQARRTTSHTHAGPTTRSHPASRRLLDNALPRSPLRAGLTSSSKPSRLDVMQQLQPHLPSSQSSLLSRHCTRTQGPGLVEARFNRLRGCRGAGRLVFGAQPVLARRCWL